MLQKINQNDFIRNDGHYWLTSEALGDKLGFMDSRNGVQKIYQRNQEELEPFRTVVKLSTVKGDRDITVFDEQGCYIIAMLAKTEQAKLFRRALAQFLKSMREQQLSFLDMLDEYNDLQKKLSLLKLQEKLRKNNLKKTQFNRLTVLWNVLTLTELSRLFDLSARSLREIHRLHCLSTGETVNNPSNKLTDSSLERGALWQATM